MFYMARNTVFDRLSTLKVGDEAALCSEYLPTIVRVARVTPKQIVIEGGRRFWKETGRCLSLRGYYLSLVDKEIRETIEHAKRKKEAKATRSAIKAAADALFRVEFLDRWLDAIVASRSAALLGQACEHYAAGDYSQRPPFNVG